MEAIVQILDQQIEVHRHLLELSLQKRQSIISNDVEQLMQMTQKETRLIRQVDQLETERADAVQSYMRSRNMYVTAAITIQTLSKIAVKLEEKQSLADRREQLLDLIEEIRKANELNQQLIQHSLAYINYSMDLLVDSGEQDAIYHHPLQEQAPYRANRMFDRKA
ncbi:flagellar protein FlgN [Paenibacillus hodogayensis]|uniref:Flagellar protein FlgN n=1 Tax=Paenibacillus hodogayensis TaxID=279208 RepID=A0ABV5W7E7_9BACL